MKDKILDLLMCLSERMPPPEGHRGHHSITCDGGKFVLQVIRPDGLFQPFMFDEQDERKSLDQLFFEIEGIASRPIQ